MHTAIAAPTWTTLGAGTPVVALHGGPGDPCGYLSTLAGLLPERQWVLYNQAGSGIHPLDTPPELSVDYLIGELDALRQALDLAQLTLVGHSWGAELALSYAAAHPERVTSIALIGTGPLTPANTEIARANLLRPLNSYERAALATARELRLEALEAEDMDAFNAITLELVTAFYAKSWLYDHSYHAQFTAIYTESYAESGFNPFAHRRIIASQDHIALWERLPAVTAPVLIIYGCQDFEPITQAYELQAVLPNAHIRLLNAAGHLPWLEQPEAVQQALREFWQ